MKDQMDGLDIYVAGKATVNFVFDRYMRLKNNLKPTTKSNYFYMYDRFIRDTLGKRNIVEIKYSDVVQFYNHLTKKQELRWLMTTFQQVQSSIKMNGNANRD
jgi:integrase